jgi:hypothetical protein
MQFIRPQQFKANLHCHSTLSDGTLTPEALKQLYRSHGYSILSITDHERPHDHSALNEPDFLLLTGYEAYIRPDPNCRYDTFSKELHLNLFARDPRNTDLICWNDRYVKYVDDPAERAAMHRFGSEETRQYTAEYINRFIETAREDGYLVTLNHPVWSMEDFSEVFRYDGYFSMEICNFSAFQSGLNEYNTCLYDMLLRRGRRVFAHSADDNHNEIGPGRPGDDSFGGFTMFNLPHDALTYDGVIAAMDAGTFYSSMGPTIRSLEIADDRAVITCSDASRIAMIYGAKTTRTAFPAACGETIDRAEFKIPPKAAYVRFTVTDEAGRHADTRGYFRDEWAAE